MTTVKEALAQTSEELAHASREPAARVQHVAELFLCALLARTRSSLYLHQEERLSEEQEKTLAAWVARRREGEPVQYILGEAPFRHLVLKTAPGVLIPRPETELLVDIAKEKISSMGIPSREPVRIADIGTGSGAIALSLASECCTRDIVLYASDISEAALALVHENIDVVLAEKLGQPTGTKHLHRKEKTKQSTSTERFEGVEIHVLKSDLFASYPQELKGEFQIVVSNPPYLPRSLYQHGITPEIRDYEPREALEAGEDGLAVFVRLEKEAHTWLCERGFLCVELFEGHMDEAVAFLEERGGWDSIEVHQDLTGRPRILSARKIGKRREEDAFARTVDVLVQGGVALVPTDSVYGLVAPLFLDAAPNREAAKKIYALKKRPLHMKLPLLIADTDDLEVYANHPSEQALKLAKDYWPGALTLIVEASSAVPREFRAEDGSVALRLPDDSYLRELARALGPLLSTSANMHGEPALIALDNAPKTLLQGVDIAIDGGTTARQAASTIVDVREKDMRILRHGAVDIS